MTCLAFLLNPVIVCALSAAVVSPLSPACGKAGSPGPRAELQARGTEPLNTSELFSRLAARHRWQEAHINQLSAVRNYCIRNSKGKVLAREVVVVEYRAPGKETFTTRSGDGSRFIRSHVFHRLMKFEADRLRSRKNQDSLINAENYTLEIVGSGMIDNSECLVARAAARRKERDLFTGEIWINKQTFAIVRMTGEPAKSPSFWIKHVHFTREYLRAGEFWLPSTEQAVLIIRFFGPETLTIDYHDYSINGQRKSLSSAAQESGRSGI